MDKSMVIDNGREFNWNEWMSGVINSKWLDLDYLGIRFSEWLNATTNFTFYVFNREVSVDVSWFRIVVGAAVAGVILVGSFL